MIVVDIVVRLYPTRLVSHDKILSCPRDIMGISNISDIRLDFVRGLVNFRMKLLSCRIADPSVQVTMQKTVNIVGYIESCGLITCLLLHKLQSACINLTHLVASPFVILSAFVGNFLF